MTEESHVLRIIHIYGPDRRELALVMEQTVLFLCWVYLHFLSDCFNSALYRLFLKLQCPAGLPSLHPPLV